MAETYMQISVEVSPDKSLNFLRTSELTLQIGWICEVGKSYPLTCFTKPLEFQEVEAPAEFATLEIFLVVILVTDWVDSRAIVRPEGLSLPKILIFPRGNEPTASRLVAQCLHQLHHRVPRKYEVVLFYFVSPRMVAIDGILRTMLSISGIPKSWEFHG